MQVVQHAIENIDEEAIAEFQREPAAGATAERIARGEKASATPKRYKPSKAEKKRRKRDRVRASA